MKIPNQIFSSSHLSVKYDLEKRLSKYNKVLTSKIDLVYCEFFDWRSSIYRFSIFIVFRGSSSITATSKMERFVLIVNGWSPLTVITKCSILDVTAIVDPHLILLLKSSPSCLSFESSEIPSEKICVALTSSVWLQHYWSRLIIQNQITTVFYFEFCWIFVVCLCLPHKWFIFFVKHYISLRWKIQPFNSICER